jgi:hypothetical protein
MALSRDTGDCRGEHRTHAVRPPDEGRRSANHVSETERLRITDFGRRAIRNLDDPDAADDATA